MSVTLILPCCGDSTRFPGNRPKFLLTHPSGKSMLAKSIGGLGGKEISNIVCVIRRDHVERYNFLEGLKKQFSNNFHWCILDQKTNSQVETVAMAIMQFKINGSIAIKDCDNFFRCPIPRGNFVAVSRLQDQELINPNNKNYVISRGDSIVHIEEKKIVSDTFGCGLYCFGQANHFLEAYKTIKPQYISGVVNYLLNNGYYFGQHPVKDYVDWGTLEDWNRYKESFETIFIDLDGVLVENSSEFFDPRWGTTNCIEKNVRYLERKYQTGKVSIIITTCRTEEYSTITEKQLAEYAIPYDRIIYGLPHSRRVLINDYAPSNPYPSCYAVNLPRNADILGELMK